MRVVNLYRVLVIGLSAGRLLKANGCDVTILEARDRVGGRTYTVRDDKFGYTDVGGAYVGPSQRRVQRLAKELDLEFYKVYTKGKRVIKVRSLIGSFQGTTPPTIDPFLLLDLNDIQRRLNNMANEVPVEAPYKARKAEEWDRMTVKEFADKYAWYDVTKELVAVLTRSILGCEPHDISLLSFVWYIRSGGSIQRLMQTTDGAQECKFVGGSMQLSEQLAASLDVHLREAVTKIQQNDTQMSVATTDGKSYDCDYVISAIAPTLLNRIQFIPTLSARKIQMIQRVPMGSIIKTITFYKEAFWQEKGFCGELVSDKGPIGYCIDDTKPDGSSPAIMGFMEASRARSLCEMTQEERAKRICEHYADMFDMPEFLHPVHYEEFNWASDEYSGGCYTSIYPPGVLTSFGDTIREPHGRVYFASTETATSWSGYMEGAIEAGERAAREILHDMGRIPESQIYQQEAFEPGYFPDDPIQLPWIEQQLPSVTRLLWFCATVGVVGAAVVARVLM